jgi:hypothetical protein
MYIHCEYYATCYFIPVCSSKSHIYFIVYKSLFDYSFWPFFWQSNFWLLSADVSGWYSVHVTRQITSILWHSHPDHTLYLQWMTRGEHSRLGRRHVCIIWIDANVQRLFAQPIFILLFGFLSYFCWIICT